MTLSASDKTALDGALRNGMRPRPTGGSRGLVVTVPGSAGGKNTYRILIDRRGNITAAGKYFYDKLNAEPPDRGFDPNQQPKRATRGRSETIQLRDGSTAVVRTWNHLKGEWKLTKVGKQFFGNRQDRWLVRIPVRIHQRRINGTYYVHEGWIDSTSISALGEMAFPASMSEDEQRAEVKRQVRAWLDSLTDEMDGERIIVEGDYDPQTYDPTRDIEYSREETRIVDGHAQVTATVDRPLRQIKPWVFCDLFNVHNLAPEAFNTPEDQNCVAHQLEVLVRSGGHPMWTRKQLEDLLDEIQERLYGDGEEPYWDDEAQEPISWRQMGVTSRMIVELCKRYNVPVKILWNNAVVESWVPHNISHMITGQALQIRGDHAYFYRDPYTKQWITKHDRQALQSHPTETMQLQRRPVSDGMGAWTPMPAEFELGLKGDFYVVGQQEMMSVRAEMHRHKVCPEVFLSGPSPHDARRLQVKVPGHKEALNVRRVHPEYETCMAFVTELNRHTGGNLKYNGESPGSLMASAFEELTRPCKREDIPKAIKSELVASQNGRCADCGDDLERFEVDHRVPLCFGGTNELANLAAICGACHSSKCYFENLSQVEDRNPLISRFNRETHEAFALSPKPPQLVANLHKPTNDDLTLHIDVRRCRFTQFLENVHGLPVFCALDDIVPTTEGRLGDYNYIHRTRDLRSPQKLLPYWGPGWYWRPEVEWMLDVGIVKWSEILYTFTASCHFPPSYLADRLRQLEVFWQTAQETAGSNLDSKFALNSMFGIWSIQEHYTYHLKVASDPDDVIAHTLTKTPSPGSVFDGEGYVLHDYVTKTKQITFASMRPVHQICLSQERLVMSKLVYLLSNQLSLSRRLLSIRNDGLSVQPGKHMAAVKNLAENMTYGSLTRLRPVGGLHRYLPPPIETQSHSDTKVFRVECKPPDMPGGTLSIHTADPLKIPIRQWTVHTEVGDTDDFYERFIQPHVIQQQRGALITGAAGTGKSTILSRLEVELMELGHDVRKISLTHVACKRLGDDASTAHAFVHRHVLHGRFRGWLLIDEVSMLHASLLTLLENLSILGVKIVMFGDWNQLLAPMNHWRIDKIPDDAFQHSRLMHIWAEGTEFRLTRCRRTTRGFFDICQRLLTVPFEMAVAECRERFPPRTGPLHLQADMHLVLSHHRRRRLNALCQEAAVDRYKASHPEGLIVKIEPPGNEERGLNKAQPFDLFDGTRLIGVNNDTANIVNGGFMTVGAVREHDCDVTNEFGAVFRLTHEQIGRSTRLAWAITVTSSQSREFDCRVCLWDLDSPFYTTRHLYVAMSRVKRPAALVVVP